MMLKDRYIFRCKIKLKDLGRVLRNLYSVFVHERSDPSLTALLKCANGKVDSHLIVNASKKQTIESLMNGVRWVNENSIERAISILKFARTLNDAEESTIALEEGRALLINVAMLNGRIQYTALYLSPSPASGFSRLHPLKRLILRCSVLNSLPISERYVDFEESTIDRLTLKVYTNKLTIDLLHALPSPALIVTPTLQGIIELVKPYINGGELANLVSSLIGGDSRLRAEILRIAKDLEYTSFMEILKRYLKYRTLAKGNTHYLEPADLNSVYIISCDDEKYALVRYDKLNTLATYLHGKFNIVALKEGINSYQGAITVPYFKTVVTANRGRVVAEVKL